MDVVSLDGTYYRAGWYINLGEMAFAARIYGDEITSNDDDLPISPHRVWADDLDGDGDAEIIYSAIVTGAISIIENESDQVDTDGDGYLTTEDCNDCDEAINPSAEDVDTNGIDEDCNGGRWSDNGSLRKPRH